jgi:hypothetical protein
MENVMADELETQEDSVNFRLLKQQKATAEADAAKWKTLFEGARSQLLSSAVQLAGFKPNELGEFEGVTGLLVEKFQSGLGDEDMPDVSAFGELAKQYGVEATISAPAGEQPPAGGEQPPADDFAAQLTALQKGGDALIGLGQALVPADIDERIAKATDAGDVQAVIHLQQQKAYAGVA